MLSNGVDPNGVNTHSSGEKDPKIIPGSMDTKWLHTDVDGIWHSLGRFGKYQLIQLGLHLYLATNLAQAVVNGMFAGKTIDFRCAYDNNSLSMFANRSIKISSCHVQVLDDNTSTTLSREDCTEYEYEGSGTILSYIAEWDLVCDKETMGQLPQIMTMVGMVVGATTLPHLGDRYGRKKLIVGASVSQFIVAVFLAFADKFELFLFLKFLSGAFQQGVMVPLYSLELEVMPLELRPLVSFFQTSAWVVSVCIIGVTGYVLREFHWRQIQLACALSYIPGLICLWFIDESLRWLLVNSRRKEAESILHKACNMNKKDYGKLIDTFVNVRKADSQPLILNGDTQAKSYKGSEQKDENFRFQILFVNRNMRKITFVMCYAWMICSLTYYALTLMSTSLAGDPYVNYFLSGLAEFPAGVYTYYTIRIFGRKKTIVYCNAVAGFALLVAVLVVNLAPPLQGFAIFQTCLLLIGKLAISGSFGICWTYTPELYPTNLRNYGVGITSTAARIGASFSPLFTILARKAPWAPGILFATGCFIGSFLVSLMPETRDRELPRTTQDVDQWFGQDSSKTRRHSQIDSTADKDDNSQEERV